MGIFRGNFYSFGIEQFEVISLFIVRNDTSQGTIVHIENVHKEVMLKA